MKRGLGALTQVPSRYAVLHPALPPGQALLPFVEQRALDVSQEIGDLNSSAQQSYLRLESPHL